MQRRIILNQSTKKSLQGLTQNQSRQEGNRPESPQSHLTKCFCFVTKLLERRPLTTNFEQTEAYNQGCWSNCTVTYRKWIIVRNRSYLGKDQPMIFLLLDITQGWVLDGVPMNCGLCPTLLVRGHCHR